MGPIVTACVGSYVGPAGPTAMAIALVVGVPTGVTTGTVGCCGVASVLCALRCYRGNAEGIPPSLPVAMGKSKGTELAFCENKSK